MHTGQVIFMNIYAYTHTNVHAIKTSEKEATNLKGRGKEKVRGFGQRKGNGKIL